ncbi:MAG TPA: ATP-binding protein [Mycobacteriales bacterium]|nr:ATP-binding protein [Mycobacteriales bacterium]
MRAAVPFALLSGVQLLCVVASLGLAVISVGGRTGRIGRAALASGGVLLAAAHVLTATLLGDALGSQLAVMRAVGFLLIAAGLTTWTPVIVPVLPVVAPIGSDGAPVVGAVVAALVAMACSRRLEPGVRRCLVPAFGVAALAEAVGYGSVDSDTLAVLTLVLRGVWALLVFAALAAVAQRSVRAKVVGAIVAAVVAIAVGASAVTGSVVTSGFNSSQRERISAVGRGETESLEDTAELNSRLSIVLADCFEQAENAQECPGLFEKFRREAQLFQPRYRTDGQPVADAGNAEQIRRLGSVAALALGQSDAVKEVVSSGATVSTLMMLPGSPRFLCAVGVSATREGGRDNGRITGAAVYATVVDDARVETDAGRAGYEVTVLDPEGSVVASSLDARERAELVDLYAESDAVSALGTGDEGALVEAEGSRPTARFTPIIDARGDLVAVLSMSASSEQILRTQRNVLRVLFGTTLLIGLLAALLALALARRITRPIEQLTVTASRIRRGDLTATADVRSADEVGVLSRAFDAMTRSLSASNNELRDAAAEQSSLRARLATIVDSMGDGLLITDSSGRVTGLNPVGEQLLGVKQDAAIGEPVDEVLVGTTTAGAPLLDGNFSVPRTGTVVRPDGTRVDVAVVRTPLRDGGGSVVVLRDTTRETQVERMKTEFLSNVSHELRTPLTPIRGYAEILHRRPDLSPEKTQQYAASILDSSVRMSRVVDLLVDVAALEAGRVIPAPAAVSIKDVIDHRLELWRVRAPDREFRRRIGASLPMVVVDEEWLAKALDELIDNAVKYAGDGSVVTLSASSEGAGRVRLAVRDNGPGIPAEAQSHLFTDFEQVDGSATRSVGGLGMGLSFVRRVAEDFGLGLGYTTTPGKGTTFWLDLPAVPTRARPRRTTKAAARAR